MSGKSPARRTNDLQNIRGILIVQQAQSDTVEVSRTAWENARLAVQHSGEIYQAVSDYQRMIAEINSLVDRITLLAMYTGPGDRLSAYVCQQNAHDFLIGRLEDLATICERGADLGSPMIPSAVKMKEFVDGVRAFANLCNLIITKDIEGNRSDGEELVAHLKATPTDYIKNLFEALSNIDRGGRDEGDVSKITAALKRLAQPYVTRHKGKSRIWRRVANDLWDDLDKTKGKGDPDREMIYREWQYTSLAEHRRQVKYVFTGN